MLNATSQGRWKYEWRFVKSADHQRADIFNTHVAGITLTLTNQKI